MQDCLPNVPTCPHVTCCRHAQEAPGPTGPTWLMVSWHSCWRSGPRAAIRSLTVLPVPAELVPGTHARPKEHGRGRGLHTLHPETQAHRRHGLLCHWRTRAASVPVRSDVTQQQAGTWVPRHHRGGTCDRRVRGKQNKAPKGEPAALTTGCTQHSPVASRGSVCVCWGLRQLKGSPVRTWRQHSCQRLRGRARWTHYPRDSCFGSQGAGPGLWALIHGGSDKWGAILTALQEGLPGGAHGGLWVWSPPTSASHVCPHCPGLGFSGRTDVYTAETVVPHRSLLCIPSVHQTPGSWPRTQTLNGQLAPTQTSYGQGSTVGRANTKSARPAEI